ncbi:hypothetical protein Dsin_021669 [Dipteronia sinensis]|uniref:DUF1985 domain-containing protein n=1 Tax=Dipteronia sinensis TaxID=43782 RepID=A0AAE0A0L4_9ROSI|nr:hypothetical protein Dsin_021669 [Dipteronia sinensis]
MWFGLGKSKVRFGQEEFCLCIGLKMGQLPEGFANNNEVEEDSMLRRIFKGKRPTAEVLYATLKRMSSEESEDVYKMLNIYMVSQFFGMDDGRTTAISGWLFSLVENEDEFKKFPWGSYIFSFTLFFLKDVLNKRLPKLRDYFKSLNIEYVCGPLIDKKREKLALPRSEEEEDLGSDHEGDDNQTGNDNDGIDCSVQKEEIGGSVGRTRSTFSNQYSPHSKKRLFSDRNPKVPSTIPELYDAMLESEQRIIAFCREEFSKIIKEMKNGAEQADDVVDDKGAGNNVKSVEELNSVGEVGEVGELGKDVQQDAVAEVGKGGEEDDAFGDVDAAFQGGKGEEKDDEVSDVNAAFEGCKGDEQEDDAGEIGKGSKEGVGSDCVVVADTAFDGGKGDDQEDAVVGEIGTGCDQGVGSDGVVVGMLQLGVICLSFYTGQILPMRRQDFVDLVNIEKWISDLTNLNIKWAIEMDTLEAMRKIEKFEQAEKEIRQQTETGSPPSPQQKKDRKKKSKKISDSPLHGVNVWEDYPEFIPLNY